MNSKPPEPQTLLSLDVGQKRIGVAKGNSFTRLASPLTTIENNQNTPQTLVQLIGEHNAAALVIGLPKGLKGQETPQTSFTRQFIKLLKQHVHIPIFTQDETLSSVRAEKELRERKIGYNKESVDALAATYILEDFLREHFQEV